MWGDEHEERLAPVVLGLQPAQREVRDNVRLVVFLRIGLRDAILQHSSAKKSDCLEAVPIGPTWWDVRRSFCRAVGVVAVHVFPAEHGVVACVLEPHGDG